MESQYPDVIESQLPESQEADTTTVAPPPTPADKPSATESFNPDFTPTRLFVLMRQLRTRPRSETARKLFEGLCEALDPEQCANDCPEFETHYTDINRWHEGPDDEPYGLVSTCFHTTTQAHHRRVRFLVLPVNVPAAAVPHLRAAEERTDAHTASIKLHQARRSERVRNRHTPY
jgi:hypothetical protein